MPHQLSFYVPGVAIVKNFGYVVKIHHWNCSLARPNWRLGVKGKQDLKRQKIKFTYSCKTFTVSKREDYELFRHIHCNNCSLERQNLTGRTYVYVSVIIVNSINIKILSLYGLSIFFNCLIVIMLTKLL